VVTCVPSGIEPAAMRGRRPQINVVATPVGTTLRAVPAINRRLTTKTVTMAAWRWSGQAGLRGRQR
ncbi:MAG TPA: hypothetical protein VFC19_34665, partial [Candidatus Limnocylindrales bacterium]|nr:hypothetical protein [Candidatus Limnocylindrales bacterium]